MNESASKLSRRRLFAGAGAVGAVAAAAAVLPTVRPETAEPSARTATDGKTEGYRVTQHVLRYYETARV